VVVAARVAAERGLLGGALAVALVGCSSESFDVGAADSAVDAADAADIGVEAPPADAVADTAGCDPKKGDLVGCACATPGAFRDCFLGDRGSKSPCRVGGTQACKAGRWMGCEGATAPLAKDACYDDVDNDCNGVVDDACKGTDGYDLCKDLASGVTDAILVDPPTPKVGSTFNLFILSKGSLGNPRLGINGSYCAGGAGLAPAVAGKGCGGWNAVRQTLTTTGPLSTPGTYSLVVYVDNPGAPCVVPYSRTLTGSITIVK